MLKKLALFVVLGIHTFCGLAEAKTVIYYVNGIRTDEFDAADDADELATAVVEHLGSLPADVEFRNFHNPDNGDFADLVEATDQKLFELGVIISTPVGKFLRTLLSASAIEQQAAQSALLSLAQLQPAAPDIARFVEEIRSNALFNGDNLIIVGHSQGNFFANQAYASLSDAEKSRTIVLAVATPASFTAGERSGETKYITDNGDVIWLIPTARFWNNINSFNPFTRFALDVLGHSFKKYYLHRDFRSRDVIAALVSDAIAVLRSSNNIESFETYPLNNFPSSGGWVLRSGAAGTGAFNQFVSNTVANFGSQSMHLESSAGLAAQVYKPIDMSGLTTLRVEGFVYPTRTDSRNAIIGILFQDAGAALAEFYPNGVITARTNDLNIVPLASYAANTWVKVGVQVDVNAQTYDVIVNDAVVGQNIPFLGGLTSLPNSVFFASDNNLVGAGGTGDGGTVVYFDDIEFTKN